MITSASLVAIDFMDRWRQSRLLLIGCMTIVAMGQIRPITTVKYGRVTTVPDHSSVTPRDLEKPSGPWFDLWWVIDLPWFEFKFRKLQWFYPTICFMWRNVFVCLMMCRWGAAWRAVIRIEAGVGDLVQRIGDGQAQVGYSVVGRSRGRVMLCAVYTVHKETRRVGFLVQPQNQGQRFLPVWPQNRWL
jgi:hypothetical protein